MSSIRNEPVAIDSNEYIFAIRGDPEYAACQELLFEHLDTLRVLVPQQIIVEVHRNLHPEELKSFYDLLETADEVLWDYSNPPVELIQRYEALGAKKGDAAITAHLHIAGVNWLV